MTISVMLFFVDLKSNMRTTIGQNLAQFVCIMAGICSFNCSVESIEHIEENHQWKTKWGNSKIFFSQKLQI
jgi:hypothetical protein